MSFSVFQYFAAMLVALSINGTTSVEIPTRSTDAHFQFAVKTKRGIGGCSGQAVTNNVMLTVAHCMQWTNDGYLIYENRPYRYKMLNVGWMRSETFDGPVLVQVDQPIFANRKHIFLHVLDTDKYDGQLIMKCYPSYKDKRPGQRYVKEVYHKWSIRYDTTDKYFIAFSPTAWYGCSGGALYDNRDRVVAAAVTIFFASGVPNKVLVSFSAVNHEVLRIWKALRHPKPTQRNYWNDKELDL